MDVNSPVAKLHERTALHVAAECGHVGVVDYLVLNGAKPSLALPDADGLTPSMLALTRGHQHVACVLLAAEKQHAAAVTAAAVASATAAATAATASAVASAAATCAAAGAMAAKAEAEAEHDLTLTLESMQSIVVATDSHADGKHGEHVSFDRGMTAFYRGDFDSAKALFEQVLAAGGGGAAGDDHASKIRKEEIARIAEWSAIKREKEDIVRQRDVLQQDLAKVEKLRADSLAQEKQEADALLRNLTQDISEIKPTWKQPGGGDLSSSAGEVDKADVLLLGLTKAGSFFGHVGFRPEKHV